MVTSAEPAIPHLAQLPPDLQHLVLAYYEAGLTHGFDLGYRAAQHAEEARWAAIAATIHHTTRGQPYDQLRERRGEPDRAQIQRRALRERGVW